MKKVVLDEPIYQVRVQSQVSNHIPQLNLWVTLSSLIWMHPNGSIRGLNFLILTQGIFSQMKTFKLYARE